MIRIENLHYRYADGTHALRGIYLTIVAGEFVLLCGPNGSGKTTLTRLMCGLLKPSEGSVRLNGVDHPHLSNEIRSSIGMVFQDPDSQIIGETVREDVAFGPENMGLPKSEILERVEWALQAMDLKDLSDKPCDLLSGGEKRRLSIAGVLAMRPRIILFDEPFSHLDYPGIREVLKHMVRLHREGHTLVVTTHDVEKVIACVDRVAIIYKGEIKGDGSPREMMNQLARFGVRPPCYALFGKEPVSWLSE